MKLKTVILFLLLLLPIVSMANEEGGNSAALPSLIGMLTHHEGLVYEWVNIIYAMVVSIFLCIIAVTVYKKRKMIPGPFQNGVEMLVEGMSDFLHSILGKNAPRYVPFLGTLFFYILMMNFIGIIPLGHSPSTNINITASLAIMVFLYAQYTGLSRLGIKGYVDHLLGQPRDIIGWAIAPMILPIHIIGEFAKPFSLALRLFGNITGEDILVAAFVGLGITALSFMHSPVGLPLHVPFILLGLLMSTIQALVFTLLSTIYILMMLPHDHSEHAEPQGAHH
jgi:F-type H+-transporting ATPase subunit a